MPRGGRRSGAPGKSYANRSDLNTAMPVKAGPSQGYGQRAALERAQQQMPVAAPTPPPAPQAPPPVQRRPLTPLTAPTQRPDEPLTAGIASGPGPGPEVLGGPADPIEAELRALYSRFPSEELRELIEDLES